MGNEQYLVGSGTPDVKELFGTATLLVYGVGQGTKLVKYLL